VLQEKRFKRVGGIDDIYIDVRIIASTNRKLEEEVEKGNFRKDLYYRLRVLPIYLSPLRDRKEDIIPLAKHFIHDFDNEFNKKVNNITKEVERILLNYDWPGNVRELKSIIERAVLLSNSSTLPAEHLLLNYNPSTNSKSESVDGDSSIAAVEKQHITKILKETSWRMTKASKILGINRTTLYNKIKQYGMKQKERA
jgi:two-component system response regulator AtoC